MGYKETCRECIEFLCGLKSALEHKESWSEVESELYEDLERYCGAIHGALESVEFYEDMKTIAETRFSPETVSEMEHSWLQLKMADTNRRLGIESNEGESDEVSD